MNQSAVQSLFSINLYKFKIVVFTLFRGPYSHNFFFFTVGQIVMKVCGHTKNQKITGVTVV